MQKKPPIIGGETPDDTYDLDNKEHLKKLGLDSKVASKIADYYYHYPKCPHVVGEFKSSSLRKSVKQLEVTVKRLMRIGKPVDFTFIQGKINHTESHIYRRRDHRLFDRVKGKFCQIPVAGRLIDIFLYYKHEIEIDYKQKRL
ncbi:MAG: hypothetical protein NWE91_01480 [Candidatus Bathyarchaeota archaeon]|nr:hypothetical protein [Candidatus Bathyarchaeota archaeon]